MNSQGPISPEIAATVYDLADALTQFRFQAERRWCGAEPGDNRPDRVDVFVGRVLQHLDNLAAHEVGLADRADALVRAIRQAWDSYSEAWQGKTHQEAMESLQAVDDSDLRCECERQALSKSPLVGAAWADVKGTTDALEQALPSALRTCFQLSSLLAAELYPTDERERRVEKLDITERTYLTVNLNQNLRQLQKKLTEEFPHLGALACDLSGKTEMKAMDKIGRVHGKLLRGLWKSHTHNAKQGESAQPSREISSTEDDSKASTLIFESGAFVYRGQRQFLSGKPLQVLKALYHAHKRVLTLRDLKDTVWNDTHPEECTIRSAVMAARKSLRAAIEAAHVQGPGDPIPVADRGIGRTAWRLDLP